MKFIKPVEILIHTAIVLAGLFIINYPGFDLTLGVFHSGNLSLLGPSIIGTIINAILFYGIVFYLIPEVLKKDGITKFLIQLLLAFTILSAVEVGVDALFIVNHDRGLQDLWLEMTIMVVFFHILVLILAFAYRFSKDWFVNEKLRRNINEWQLRSELDMLKSQINPHFLFNALNNLFSMSLQHGDEKTAEGISKLSEMMRYVFEKSSHEKVPIQNEIQYIEDYIYLQQLRFGNQVNVEFKNSIGFNSISIAPMLLISFVENAFKYGVSSQEKTNIEISILGLENRLEFVISNKIVKDNEAISSSGIGIGNVKKRLELLYPNNHSLEINDQNDVFNVKLIINTL